MSHRLRSEEDFDFDVCGPEIDTGTKSSNFATACLVMARFSFDKGGMPDALDELNRLVTGNEGGQDAEAENLRKQREAVMISLIAVTEMRRRPCMKEMESKLLERMVQIGIREGVITAEESPADIVEKIEDIIKQRSSRYDAWRYLSAQEVFKNMKLDRSPTKINPREGQENQIRYVIPRIKCQDGILARMNEREEGDKNIDNERPLMFGSSLMIKVEGCPLNLLDGTGPESSVSSAMRGLLDGDVIPQLFEWNGRKWQKRNNPNYLRAIHEIYKLDSAIVHTRWGDADEYLSVHWKRYDLGNQCVVGKQWIKAFNERKAAAPSLCEVCTLFYKRVRYC
jgi:hypothetical protein